MHFQKQDMAGTHYHWDSDDSNLMFLGQPSRRLFDRYNGGQVLFIINFYGSLNEPFSIEDGKKIEQELLNNLPLEAKSEISVFNWLRTTCGRTVNQ
jgi:hypothetical protein